MCLCACVLCAHVSLQLHLILLFQYQHAISLVLCTCRMVGHMLDRIEAQSEDRWSVSESSTQSKQARSSCPGLFSAVDTAITRDLVCYNHLEPEGCSDPAYTDAPNRRRIACTGRMKCMVFVFQHSASYVMVCVWPARPGTSPISDGTIIARFTKPHIHLCFGGARVSEVQHV